MNSDILNYYKNFVPYLLIAFIGSFLITPLVAKLAQTIKAVDLPANLRSRTDTSKEQRIHRVPKLRLGGIGVILAFIVAILIKGNLEYEVIGILLGAGVLFIVGFLDDKYEISARYQLIAQIMAATIVVIAGVSITLVDVFGFNLQLNAYSQELFSIGNFAYTFVFPADLITIFWIVALINAVNWMCGIDALGESITIITALAIAFISVETGNTTVALLAFILVGSVAGFFPYNFPPSKILGGTIADANYGFLLSTLAILSEAKMTTSLLLLVIPILDMVYVLLRRIMENKVYNPLKLLSISGSIHLHHRLMRYGFGKKTTLYLEIAFFSILAIIAVLFESVGQNFFYIHLIIIGLLFVFVLMQIISLRKEKEQEKKKKKPVARIIKDLSPEEKYKY